MNNNGSTLVLLLITIMLMGIAFMGASHEWKMVVKREKEAELLFRGDQIRNGIIAFSNDHKGRGGGYPKKLEELLYDETGVNPKRYLRKLYTDPFSEDGNWGLILDDGGGIHGVYSNSRETPFKTAGFPDAYKEFENTQSYADWKFKPPTPETQTKTEAK